MEKQKKKRDEVLTCRSFWYQVTAHHITIFLPQKRKARAGFFSWKVRSIDGDGTEFKRNSVGGDLDGQGVTRQRLPIENQHPSTSLRLTRWILMMIKKFRRNIHRGLVFDSDLANNYWKLLKQQNVRKKLTEENNKMVGFDDGKEKVAEDEAL
jgi:hypothetical protein